MKLQDLLTTVEVGESKLIDMKDGKLTVELRKLHPEAPRPPARAESPAKKHEFNAAASLASYLAKYGGDSTVIFADAPGETMYAVVDETAKSGFEILTMRPAIHPLWKPWADIAGKRLSLSQFTDFLNQNRRAVARPDGKELVMLLSQIRAAVKVEAQHGRGRNAVNGLVVTTEIQGVKKGETVELPDEITIRVPLYVDTPKQEIELDLCIEAGRDGEVYVLVSAGTVAEARSAAFAQMGETVRAGAPKAMFTFGKPAHEGWSYLDELEPTEE